MDRYLISELLPPFLFGVGAFSSLGITIDVMFELIRKVVEAGLPINIAINVFLLKLPYVIVYAFPLSTLLATLMTYSRLSSESELIALRACGVSVYRMVLTAVVLSFIVTGMTFIFNEQIVPAANYQATATLQKALKGDKPPIAQQDNFLYPEKREVPLPDGTTQKILTRLYYADQFDGKQFKGLTIIDRSREGVNQIIAAQIGEWNPSQNIWDIYNGTIYLVAPDRSYRNIVWFKHQRLKLPRTAFELAEKTRDYGEMNIAQAIQQLAIVRLGGDEQKIRKLQVRIQQKVALPFVCVVFGLVGAAMGTIPQRTGRATSFGVSIIVIFTYYLFYFISGAIAEAGIFSPFIGAWLPDFLFLGVGLFLLRRVAQR
ncbi:LptF/LptG family permease [Aetokthonos hydrillicola Thurmond2011]|jgi:lipopolysaccharide export system permease protein|uniref:LptF/LptG family permease n=1 Tax=Aetokthonos hydrillicola Thurmond2011 TaxID=2712845 RepID=A0AAP5MBD2_9CYAN|nr:LptF/LptG family permease [Aetokthonos hydrillicola]MBO3458879.1 YjgP/YjgQ family permease [Aetokthonos hydrillicola CCALA 1050]MBW4587273.1 LptF/LptG family permease [Aetokthonos hydrillicola CCALA 1050]MDR9896704.1 LptF/LptG family permease [Aetokthonos hydrillicola Thurmond2011]